MICLSKSAG